MVRRHALLRNALVRSPRCSRSSSGRSSRRRWPPTTLLGLHGLVSLFLYNGLLNGDPYLIEAPIVLVAVIVVVASIVADIACAALDPRLRYG